MAIKVREMLRLLHQDGWRIVRQTGSHRHLRHPTKPGTVTVAGRPGEDMHPKTAATILKYAGIAATDP
jgi:predicted RNA binding protein YcfA (HicA-like mRNA interferase family)